METALITMNKFQLFDSVKLNEGITLSDRGTASEGTVGAIVEVFNDGEAYMVELFDGWVKYDATEILVPADALDSESLPKTIGVETVYPQHLQSLRPT